MNIWILVLFVHAGPLSDKDSMALTNIPGFKSQAACEASGRAAEVLTKATTKSTRWVCLKQE